MTALERESNNTERCINSKEQAWVSKTDKEEIAIFTERHNKSVFWNSSNNIPIGLDKVEVNLNNREIKNCARVKYLVIIESSAFQKYISIVGDLNKPGKRKTDQLLGYHIDLKPIKFNKTDNRNLTCGSTNCLQTDFADFKFEEEFEIAIFPITRAIFAKDKVLPPKDTPHKQFKVITEKFNCKRNGSLVEISRKQLCNNINDCDIDDDDKYALDEKPEICQGSIARLINIGYFSAFFVILVTCTCISIFKKPCEDCEKKYLCVREKEEKRTKV